MIPITLSNAAMIIAVAVILFVTDPVLALVALAPLPLVNIAGRRFSESIHPAVLAVQAEQADLATVVEETIGGVRVIKGFGAEEVQAAKLRKEADDIQRESIKAARVRATYLPMIELLPQFGLVAVLGVGGMQVINGDLTLGQLVQFNFYVALLVSPLRMLGMTIAWGQRAAVALQRVNEVLEISPDVMDPEHPLSLPAADGHRCGPVRRRALRLRPRGAGARRLRPRPSAAGSRWRSSVRPARASRPSPACSPGSTTSSRAACRSTAIDVRDSRVARRAARGGHRVRGHVAVPRHRRRQHRLRRPGRDDRADRAGRPTGRRPRLHHGSARRATSTDARRARLLAVGRPAPAHRDRPGDPRRPAGAGARRRDLSGRPVEGARDPRPPWPR